MPRQVAPVRPGGGGACGRPLLLLPPPRGGAGSLGARTRVELPFPAAAPPDPTRPGPARPWAPGAFAQRRQSQPASAAFSGARSAHLWPRPPSRQPAGAWLRSRGDRRPTQGSQGPRPSAAMAPVPGDAGRLERGEVWSARPGRAAQASEEGMEGGSRAPPFAS